MQRGSVVYVILRLRLLPGSIRLMCRFFLRLLKGNDDVTVDGGDADAGIDGGGNGYSSGDDSGAGAEVNGDDHLCGSLDLRRYWSTLRNAP